ncbi:MAG: hypothetical protein JNL80_08890 [Phycisphaerae bacterium]|nr:hypothetical protein [Phycisphaerae bacterium]
MNHLTNPATPVDRPAAVGAAMTVAFSIGLLAAASSGQTNSGQTGPVQPGSEGAPATAPPEAPPAEKPIAQGGAEAKQTNPDAKPPVPAPDPEKTRTEKEADLRQRFLPEPLNASELAALDEELGMTPESQLAFVDVCARYTLLSQEARGDASRELLRLLPAAFRYDPHETEFEPIYTPELLDLHRQYERVGESIARAEDYLARELRNLADPARRSQLRLVLSARAEALYARPARLPGARVNLLDLLPKAGLSASDLAGLDVALDRYAQEYIAALIQRHATLRDIETRKAQALVGLGPEWRAGRTIAEAIGVERELAAFEVAEVRSDIGLRDLNSATLERMRKTLSPNQSRRVLLAWQSIVHPELFEEDRLARIVMERFISMPEVTPESRSTAIDRFLQLEDQLWPLGQQAVELADNVVVAERLPPTDAAQVRIALDEQIHKIQIRRRKVVREAVHQMQTNLPAEQAEFAKTLQDTLLTLDAQDRASRFLMNHLAQRQQELQTLLAMGEIPATSAKDAPAPGEATSPETVPVGDPDGSGTQEPVPPPPGAQPPNAEGQTGSPASGDRDRGNRDSPRRDGRGSRRSR